VNAGNDIFLSFFNWIQKELFEKKLMSPGGIILLMLLAVGAGYFAFIGMFYIPVLLGFAIIGLVIVYNCIFYPLNGFYITCFVAFFAFYPGRLLNKAIPLSTGVEVLTLLLFIGTLFASKKSLSGSNSLLKTPVSIGLLLYTLFYAAQAFNPNMLNIGGWLFSFKRYLIFIMFYVIAYRLIDTPQKFRFFIKFWIGFSLLAALYGCYQQWFGLLPMELKNIMSDPHEFMLLNQGGVIRKFSFLSDVVTFGVLSGSMAVLSIIIAIGEPDKKRKRWLFVMAFFMLLGMTYSGTRTTNIILPAGIALYIIMTIQNKTTMITILASIVLVMFILFAPIHNSTLNRIRSTFDSKEASHNVRDINRAYIQPYVRSHPLGGGVATSGVDGMRFNRGHVLAGFPTDSGFLRVAVEQGWVGLALNLLLFLVILYQGIHYYFIMRIKEYKTYVVAIICTIFSIIVTQYSQVSIGQFPGAIFLFSCFSLIHRLREFDEEETNLKKYLS
jgi:putative inorganic carbon (hco3(-)) transporter